MPRHARRTPLIADDRVHELLAPLRARRERAALLFDVDGTLAPIVSDPGAARVPAATREILAGLTGRYGLVACLSGRRATDARTVVGLDTITYVGNHGLETLAPGTQEPEALPDSAAHAAAIRDFVAAVDTGELHEAGIRMEDKEAIWTFHWREADDEDSARALLEAVARRASAEGLVPHWGRKVLEVRPAVAIDKGTAVERLLAAGGVEAVLFGGDDATDLDAFAKLHELLSNGAIAAGVCVGVRSREGPAGIVDSADLVVDGTDGFRELLALL
jgi:trehalose-phosphatase